MESPEGISGRWGVVRAEWLFNPDVGVDEFALLACLSTYQDKAGLCWPSQSTLAARLKRSRPWIIKVLNRLEQLGLIERTRRLRGDGGLRSCLYRIVPSEACAIGIAADAVPEHASSGPRHDRGCHGDDMNQTHPIQERISLPREAERVSGGVAKPVPDGWTPSAQDLAWAAKTHPGIDAEALTKAFVTGCRAKGYRYIDVGCAWRGWFANQERWRREREGNSHDGAGERAKPSLGKGTGRAGNPSGAPGKAGAEHRTGADLAGRNAAEADACLERILARRTGHPPAGNGPG
ncbi:hypothetical protein GGE65_006013 [Skermanella aerolata]|uniref:helix-turn-helix domain-containing protein n=1 Tax=Skermanella aerolata TaxID=393310 RepID=UPI003D252121